MALIDEEVIKDNENNKLSEINCKLCNKKINNDSPILLCESCFNATTQESLDKIKDNIIKIKLELEKIETSIKQINIDYKKDNIHIVLKNKLEIDLLNLEAIKQKINIDLETNKKAFIINQIQANDLRKIQNWASFDIIKLEE